VIMATIAKNILPIPESIVVGSGGYTVPANKYGYLSACARTAISISQSQAPVQSVSAAAATLEQWIPAGTSMSTSTAAPSGASGLTTHVSYVSSASLNIDSLAVLGVVARAALYTGGGGSNSLASTSTVGWSVALFPIPVNNLPASLIT
jgi:hypothetical protein